MTQCSLVSTSIYSQDHLATSKTGPPTSGAVQCCAGRLCQRFRLGHLQGEDLGARQHGEGPRPRIRSQVQKDGGERHLQKSERVPPFACHATMMLQATRGVILESRFVLGKRGSIGPRHPSAPCTLEK